MVSTETDESDNVDIEYHNNVNGHPVIKPNSPEIVNKVTTESSGNYQDQYQSEEKDHNHQQQDQEPSETDYTSSDSDSWVAECYYKTVTFTSDNNIGDQQLRPETRANSDIEDTGDTRHNSCSPSSLCQTDQVCWYVVTL